ncbi:hypothetical protein HZB08_01600 [Candidatus Saganbacteria bacterium]|uniref:Uncharacterized protein n=1 Tax=Candidatus Saganbacteria bacterium TaxID=2575572 RepID=A0A9D6UKC2_UNCSA|nr:hypothetical protein [Candidatus Saganbacteria bacterium]
MIDLLYTLYLGGFAVFGLVVLAWAIMDFIRITRAKHRTPVSRAPRKTTRLPYVP